MTRNRPLVLTLVALVLLSAASGVAVGTVPESDAVGPGDATDPTPPSADPGGGPDRVDETKEMSETGETGETTEAGQSNETSTQLVVRLAEAKPSLVDRNGETKPTLKSHAETTQTSVREYADRHDGVTVVNSLWLTNAVLVEVGESHDSAAVADDLTVLPDVESVHPNYVYRVDLETPVPTDRPTGVAPAQADTANVTPGLAAIDAPAAWEAFGTRGEGVRVAVLDTGVDATHPDIDLHTSDAADPTFPDGWVEFNSIGLETAGSTPTDTFGHGTHVSGTLTGGDESGTAIGVAPDATLLVGKVLNDDGTATFFQVIAGMQWAVESDADVVSMSLGALGHHPEFVRPVDTAERAGVVVVAASGNDGPGQSVSPGNVFEVVSVGAVDDEGVVASFSSREVVDTAQVWGDAAPSTWPKTYSVPRVAAPGVDVESSLPGGGYGTASGTSMATPHVAGTVALVLAAAERPLTPDEVRRILAESAVDEDEVDGVSLSQTVGDGAGVVNARAAVELAASQSDPNEPNDEQATATPVEDTAVQGIVDDPTDVDWFRVETGDTPLAVGFERVDGTGTLQASIVSVGPAEWSVDEPTVELGPGESVDGTVGPPAGTYLVRVRSGADGGTGGYQLSVVPDEQAGDVTEPNDAANAATPLPSGTATDAEVTPAGDVDFYRVDAAAGDSVVVELQFSDDRGDLDLGIYDAEGTLLDQSISTSDEEQVEYVADTDGPLYVTVVGFAGAGGPYTVEATLTASSTATTTREAPSPPEPNVSAVR